MMITPQWVRDGGVGAHVEASATLLARTGVEVTVVVARVVSDVRVPGVTLLERPKLFDTAAGMDARLGEALSLHPTVVHLHQVDDPEIVGAMRTNAPVVVSAHGYTACTSGVYYFRPGHECSRAHGPGCVPNLLVRGCAHTRNLTTLPARYGHATRGLDALLQADLAVSYSTSVDRHLAANGIAHRRIVPDFPTILPKHGSGHRDRRRVVFAGRVVRPKGVAVLIRAAREVDAEFVICGDGHQMEAMRRLAHRMGVQERVCFKGWLDGEQLAQEFAEASVVVVPSLWPEPFGLVGIEAFAAGRPAIATATGGISDWLQDGVSGLAVAPGAVGDLARALDEILADPDRQQAMGRAGKEMVAARFSPERHLEALLDGYEAACATWRADGELAASHV
jgi:glycosyltransferase involved in cell wall biosynthesis